MARRYIVDPDANPPVQSRRFVVDPDDDDEEVRASAFVVEAPDILVETVFPDARETLVYYPEGDTPLPLLLIAHGAWLDTFRPAGLPGRDASENACPGAAPPPWERAFLYHDTMAREIARRGIAVAVPNLREFGLSSIREGANACARVLDEIRVGGVGGRQVEPSLLGIAGHSNGAAIASYLAWLPGAWTVPATLKAVALLAGQMLTRDMVVPGAEQAKLFAVGTLDPILPETERIYHNSDRVSGPKHLFRVLGGNHVVYQDYLCSDENYTTGSLEGVRLSPAAKAARLAAITEVLANFFARYLLGGGPADLGAGAFADVLEAEYEA